MQTPLSAPRTDAEDGLSLVELMFAIFILAVSILALAGVATSSVASVRVARDQQQASDLASAEVEAVRGIDFVNLALDTATYPGTAAPAPYGSETVLDVSGGPVQHKATIQQGSQTFSVTRWVTEAVNHNSSSDQDPIKRLIVHVAWDDRGTTRRVTDSTIVADADRGLPVPRFDLAPDAVAVTFDPGQTSEVCETFTVLNLGLKDSYAWRLAKPADSSDWTETDDGIYTDTSKKWKARATFQGPDDPSPLQMTNSRVESGDKWMESSVRLESRRSAAFTVCFTSTASGGADISNELEYKVFLRSRFDESVVHEATVAVTVSLPRMDLYLHENTDNHTGSWNGTDHNRKKGSKNYPIMFMDPNPAVDELLHDMDADHDPADEDGISLDPSNTDSFAVWDYTVNETQQMATIKVSIWARATADSHLTFLVQRVSSTGTVLETYGTDSQAAAFSASDSFAVVPWSAVLSAGPSDEDADGVADISSGEVLRLTVGCSGTVLCHVDFDTQSRSGTVQVRP